MSPVRREWYIPAKVNPVIQIDTEAESAYLHVVSVPIAKTEVIRDDEIVVTADLGANGQLVGIEVVGTKEFTLDALLRDAGVPAYLFDRVREHTRYVSA